MNAKKIIKGVAKTAGKYTLKGIGKGIELAGRGAVMTVDAIVRNRGLQKIVTAFGLIAATSLIPAVGVGIVSLLGLKILKDKALSDNHKSIVDEMDDILNIGNSVTKNICDHILSPTLESTDRGIGKLGRAYQNKIDYLFR